MLPRIKRVARGVAMGGKPWANKLERLPTHLGASHAHDAGISASWVAGMARSYVLIKD